MGELSVKEINLKEFPSEILPFDPKLDITIGDAHANVINIIHKLILYGVVEMSEVEYQQLVKVYEKDVDDLTEEDITWFNEVINNLTINNPSVIRWIGDTLADRGNNDYFVLKLLEKLKKTANVEILISNHDGKFIDAYRKGSTIAEGLGKDDAKSLFNLGILLENGLVKQREVNQLVEEVYKPSLRAISYTIDNSTQPPSITLFTHAPVGFETFEEMAKLYQIPYKDDTVEDLANTIDLINEAFLAEAVLKNDLNANHEVYQNNIMLGSASIPPQYPLLRLMWNRGGEKAYELLDQHGDINEIKSIPVIIPEKPYRTTFIHGHEGMSVRFLSKPGEPPLNLSSGASYKSNIFNLDDSEVGKIALNSGKSLVFVSKESPAPKIEYKTVALQRLCSITKKNILSEQASYGGKEYKGNVIRPLFLKLFSRDYRQYSSKIAAIEKLHASLQGKKVEYTETDVLVFRNDKAKDLYQEVNKENKVPQELKAAERAYDSKDPLTPFRP